MAKRAILLLTAIGVAITAAACGRASEEDINRALGITPSPTLSAAAIATGTAAAVAAATRSAAAAAAAAGSPGGGAVPVGDVTRGNLQFETWCAGCHTVGGGGRGPDILAAGSAGSKVTYQTLLPLVRQGTNHNPPGPYKTTELSNRAVADLVAYIRSRAGP